MKCTLIFYMAHQTGYCEMALTRCLEERPIAVASVQTAFSAQMLGELLNTSLRKTPLVFIVGGLSRKDHDNLADVLSRGLQTMDPLPRVQKLANAAGGPDGYLLQTGKQAVVALPDDPRQISHMLDATLFSQL
ncbi:MAG: hypothetical protein U0M23_07520 [Acutalibacteraceae bacterium]|nr:hypothetical protein [Acutalibacteraceae bacterium]HIR03497.1 hypothetical protein [Candidatus Scatovicinus merdipullorum]